MLSCHVGWNTSHNFEKYITARFGQELSKCVAEVAKTRSRERHSDHTKQAFKGQETRKSRSSLSVHGMMALQWKLLVLTELESIGYNQYIFTGCVSRVTLLMSQKVNARAGSGRSFAFLVSLLES